MKPTEIPYKIVTPRLVIRCYTVEDTPLLQKSINESIDHLKPTMPWAWYEPESYNHKRERVKLFIERFDAGEDFTMGIFYPNEKEILGSTGFHHRIEGNACEIGYWINANHVRKGIANEATRALIKVGFEIKKMDRLEIRCDPDNFPSAHIAKKNGFTFRETLKANFKDYHNNYRDTMVWEMKEPAYRSTNIPQMQVEAYNKDGHLLPMAG